MDILTLGNNDLGQIAPKNWRANTALIASIVGAAIFTLFSIMMVMIVWRGGWSTSTEEMRIDILGKP